MVLENKKGNPHSKAYLHMLTSYSQVMTALNRPSDAADYDSKASTLKAELDAAAPGKPDEKAASGSAPAAPASAAKEAPKSSTAPSAQATAPAVEGKPKSEPPKDLAPAPVDPAKPAPDSKK
jgi:hypothetical protein